MSHIDDPIDISLMSDLPYRSPISLSNIDIGSYPVTLAAGGCGRAAAAPQRRNRPGRVVQVDPIKPKLNPPGTKRLKLECDTAFNFYFKFQLAPLHHVRFDLHHRVGAHHNPDLGRAVQVDPVNPVLKAPGSMLLKLRYDGPLSDFGFRFNLRLYTSVQNGGVMHGRGLHSSTLQLNLSRS
jgi:hypothetical protein